jgi:hypothetical protein
MPGPREIRCIPVQAVPALTIAPHEGSRPPEQILMEIQSCGEAAAEQVMSSLDALFVDDLQSSSNMRGLTALVSSLLRQPRDDHPSHLSYLAQAEDKLKEEVRALQERWQETLNSDPDLSGHVKIAVNINLSGGSSGSRLSFWMDFVFKMEEDVSVGDERSEKQKWLYVYKPRPERLFILLKKRYDRLTGSVEAQDDAGDSDSDSTSVSSISTTNPQTATTVIYEDSILPDIRTLFEASSTAVPESKISDASSQYMI